MVRIGSLHPNKMQQNSRKTQYHLKPFKELVLHQMKVQERQNVVCSLKQKGWLCQRKADHETI